MQTEKTFMLATIIIGVLFLVSKVIAIPGLPHAFYGYVILNGAPAPDGTLVVAKINGIEVASTTTKDGKYGYSPGSFYISDPENQRSGEEIRFFVNGIDTGQTKYFCNGCVTELDLIVSSPSTPPSGPGPGPSAPQPSTPTENQEKKEEPTTQACEERWVCTEWSECVNGVQTRTCSDQNNCGTDENKPLETQPCSVKETTPQTSSTPTQDITGMFVYAISNPAFAFMLVLLVIAIVLFIFRLKFRKK